ncbi:MAG: lipopolysaccharide heptosyltransferase II [Nitrospirota bacterium]
MVIQTAFIGDVVLTLPLVDALTEGFPSAKIGFVTKSQSTQLLQQDKRISEIIIYDKHGKDAGIRSFFRLSRYIRSRNFDIALLPHLSLRSTLLAYTSGIKERIGFDAAVGNILLTKKTDYDPSCHLVKRILKLASLLGVKEKERPPRIFIPPNDMEMINGFLSAEGISKDALLIGISPGATWATKRWKKEGYAQFADRMILKYGARVVILGGNEDIELAEQIAAVMKNKPVISAGKTTLTQSAALIKRCRLVVTNDSGPMHIAMTVNTPAVVIYGPTSPEVGVGGPYGENFVVVQKEGLPCRPCGTHGGKRCKKGTHACMNEISPQEVILACQKLMA